jgi:adenylate kinase family enzyme
MPQRILIVGCGGAGKSTLAIHLREELNLPVVHLDSLYWSPGWVETPKEEWLDQLKVETAKPTWVMDGNYGATLDARLSAADAVILLDLPRSVCLMRVVKRYLKYRGRTRPDMGPDCPEQLDWIFIKWIWGFKQKRRPELIKKLEAVPDHIQVVSLRSQNEVDRFLAHIRKA